MIFGIILFIVAICMICWAWPRVRDAYGEINQPLP